MILNASEMLSTGEQYFAVKAHNFFLSIQLDEASVMT